MEIAIVFVVSFVVELCGVGYTVSIAHDRFRAAIVYAVFISLMNVAILYFAIDNRALLAPSALGEIAGTITMLRLSKPKG